MREVDVNQALVGLVRGCVGDGEGRRCALVLKLSFQFLSIVFGDALENNQQLRGGNLCCCCDSSEQGFGCFAELGDVGEGLVEVIDIV